MDRRFRLWTWWLAALAVSAVAFGLATALLPVAMSRLFGWLYLFNPEGIAAFGSEAAGYIAFVTAVMGALMAGWGAAILCVLALRFRPGNADAWWLIAVSVIAWFVPDTAYSLQAGFWQNAVLNVGALGLFVVPLAATYRSSGTGSVYSTS